MHKTITIALAGLLLPALLLLAASQHAAQAQTRAAGASAELVEQNPDGTPACGQWVKQRWRACARVSRCNADAPDTDLTLRLFDRIESALDAHFENACTNPGCGNVEQRNDRNHYECVSANRLCLERSLEYRCRGQRAAPDDPPPARRLQLQQGMQFSAGGAPDLHLVGGLRLGNIETGWGEIIAMGPDSALVSEQGHCRFRYRYRIGNQGTTAAGAHVNRLSLDQTRVMADNPVDSLAPGQQRALSGAITLWSGQHVLYVTLDAEQQVPDADRGNNLRRVRVDVADGCADPRPQARPPGGGTRPIDRPTGRPMPPQQRSGTRAAPPESPQGKPAPPQGKPAPGASKPVPDDAADCRPMLSATRTTAVTRSGARVTAIAAWEAAARAMHGSGFRWDDALDSSTECSLQVGWHCTARGRPCRP